jgi:hypothetical protein
VLAVLEHEIAPKVAGPSGQNPDHAEWTPFRNPVDGLLAVARLGPLVKGWRLSVAERFDRALGNDEAVKCALAANLVYYHDDPATLWWVLFAVAQRGYLASGGRYVRGAPNG